MKKGMVFQAAISTLGLAAQNDLLTACTSGTSKIIPDPGSEIKTEWDSLFYL